MEANFSLFLGVVAGFSRCHSGALCTPGHSVYGTASDSSVLALQELEDGPYTVAGEQLAQITPCLHTSTHSLNSIMRLTVTRTYID